MKRYRFRLDAVLRVRRVQEDLAAGQLAVANHEEQAAVQRVEAAKDDYLVITVRDGVQGARTFAAERERWNRSADAITVAEQQRREAAQVVELRRSEWSEATQAVSGLERLDEKRRTEHRTETDREEAVLSDERAAERDRRRRAEAAVLAAAEQVPVGGARVVWASRRGADRHRTATHDGCRAIETDAPTHHSIEIRRAAGAATNARGAAAVAPSTAPGGRA